MPSADGRQRRDGNPEGNIDQHRLDVAHGGGDIERTPNRSSPEQHQEKSTQEKPGYGSQNPKITHFPPPNKSLSLIIANIEPERIPKQLYIFDTKSIISQEREILIDQRRKE
jgi:hypothetical protein